MRAVGAQAIGVLITLGASLWPAGAQAWPVDVYTDVRVGEERFERLAAVQWAEVEDPTIAEAEVLPSGELLITGKAKGRTLLLLYAEGKFAVWRVRVGTPPTEGEALLAAARRACGPAMKIDGTELTAPVATEGCRLALRTALEADTFRGRDLELVFDMETFQSQLKDIQQGLAEAGVKGVTARYHGAGLVLEGKVTRAERRKALWAVFKRSVGRVPLQDRLELTDEPGAQDAGTAQDAQESHEQDQDKEEGSR